MKNKFNKIKQKYFKMQKTVCKYLAIVVLFIEYWLVVVPTALIMKITRRDRLRLKKPKKTSYWVDNVITDNNYERQF